MMDEMVVIQASGSTLLRALEVGVSAYPKLEGRFLQVCRFRLPCRASASDSCDHVRHVYIMLTTLVRSVKEAMAPRTRVSGATWFMSNKDSVHSLVLIRGAMQVGNIVYSFDPSLPPGRRIVQESVLVGSKPLELSRLYAVGTKSYLVQGKDGFACLAEVRVFFWSLACLEDVSC